MKASLLKRIIIAGGIAMLGISILFWGGAYAADDSETFLARVDRENLNDLKNNGYKIEELNLKSSPELYKVDRKSVSAFGVFYNETLNKKLKDKRELKKYQATLNDTLYSQQWAIPKVKADNAWGYGVTGSSNTVVAVLDTGLNVGYDAGHPLHEDLTGRVWTNDDPADSVDNDGNGKVDDLYGWNWVENNNDPSLANGGGESYSHGTLVAGTIAANTNNEKGIAGLDWATKIMPLRVLDNNGDGWTDDIALAIEYAADNGAKVINMSFGYSHNLGPDAALEAAVNYAFDRGVVLVAASGNDGGGVNYPAAYQNVIAVGATNQSDERANWSSYGPELDVMAPGSSIYTTATNWDGGYSDNHYSLASGTSLSAPIVAAEASLLFGYDPSLSASQTKSIIETSVDKVPGMLGNQRTDYFGYGRVNFENLLGSVTASTVKAESSIFFSPWPPQIGQETTVWVDIKNRTAYPVVGLSAVVVAKHNGTGPNINFTPTTNCSTIAAGETCRLTGKTVLSNLGNYYFFIYSYLNGQAFLMQPEINQMVYGWLSVGQVPVKAVSPVYFSSWPPQAGMDTTAWVDLRNEGTTTAVLSMVITSRFNGIGTNIDFVPTVSCTSIGPGETCRLTGKVKFMNVGNYYFYIYANSGGYAFMIPDVLVNPVDGWFPAVLPQLKAVSSVYLNPWPLRSSEMNAYWVDIKNEGSSSITSLSSLVVMKKDGVGPNINFPSSTDCSILSVGQTCRLTGEAVIPSPGNYYFYIYANLGGYPFILPAKTNQTVNGWVAAG